MKRNLISLAFLCVAICAPLHVAHAEQAALQAAYDPAHELDGLFRDVQLAPVFPDSMTFVDCRPVQTPSAIVAEYGAAKDRSGFSLCDFVAAHFSLATRFGHGCGYLQARGDRRLPQ